MNIQRVKEMFFQVRGLDRKHHIAIGLGVVIFISLIAIFKFESDRKKREAAEKEEKELQMAEKLIGLYEDMADVKTQLVAKRAGLSDVSYRSSGRPRAVQVLASNQYVGFTPQNGFQEIGKTKKNFYIPRGSVFKARTVTSIKTSVAESLVVAETTQAFEMDLKRKIPVRTRLIGSARLNPILKGLVVRFDTMVLPSNTQIDGVRLLALDQQAFPELSGIFFSDKAEVYGTALAFGFLSGFASASQDRESTLSGSVPTPSLKNQTLAGVSTASFKVAEDVLKDIQQKAIEYVVLPAGETIYVVFEEKLNVDPERGLQ